MFSFQDIGENALGLWGGALGFLRRFFEKGRPSLLEPSGAEMFRDSEQLEESGIEQGGSDVGCVAGLRIGPDESWHAFP